MIKAILVFVMLIAACDDQASMVTAHITACGEACARTFQPMTEYKESATYYKYECVCGNQDGGITKIVVDSK